MILNDKFVFIHNPRTGGAFIKTMFKEILPIEEFKPLEEYHLPVSSVPKSHKDKMKFGMVRNPWAWYVSLYHFQQPNGKWLRLTKAKTFQGFVKTFLSDEFIQENRAKRFYPVGNPNLPPTVPKFEYMDNLDIGFFTYRYIYMFFNDYKEIFAGNKNIWTDHDELISLDSVLKTEELPHNIIRLLDNNGIVLSSKNRADFCRQPKKNYTHHKPYQHYYDDGTVKF